VRRPGIEVVDVDRRREGPDPREPLWEVNAAAAEFFMRMLWDDALGTQAREYLGERGISREVATRAEVGFAPADPSLLRSYMTTLGFDDARLLEVGLLLQREGEAQPRARFRGRLMFPIRDAGGRPAGFGGRVLGSGEPKYLNSPDSPAFSKGGCCTDCTGPATTSAATSGRWWSRATSTSSGSSLRGSRPR
jgi:DNA primase